MKYLKKFNLFNESNNYIDNLIGFDSDKINKDFNFYHLSPANNIEFIEKNGLLIDRSKQHKFEKGIYLADSIYVAHQYRFLDEDINDYFIIEIPGKMFPKLNICNNKIIDKKYPVRKR